MGAEETVHESENKSPEIPSETEGANSSESETFTVSPDHEDKLLSEMVNGSESGSNNQSENSVRNAIGEKAKEIIKRDIEKYTREAEDHTKKAEELNNRVASLKLGLEKMEDDNPENQRALDEIYNVVAEAVKSTMPNAAEPMESPDKVISISMPSVAAPAAPSIPPVTSPTDGGVVVVPSPEKPAAVPPVVATEQPAPSITPGGVNEDYWKTASEEHRAAASAANNPGSTNK